MSIATTNADDFRAHLRALGVKIGDHLVVHSRLLSFGRLEGGVAMVLDVLMEAVGREGTIVVPSYTLSSAKPYNPRTSPSESVGVLPEYVRTLPGVVRSACVMHSHLGLGSRVDVLNVSDGRVSFGPGSDFASLLESDFRLLLLGVGLTEGATFIHHIEATAKVPYRKWIELPRKYVTSDGEVHATSCRYYARLEHLEIEENFDLLEPVLIHAALMTRVETHFGATRLVALRDLFHYGMAALARDPYSLVEIK